jgi:hypothetical protein
MASLASRIAFKRAVFSRVARASDSYSIIAFRPPCKLFLLCGGIAAKEELLSVATGRPRPLNLPSAGRKEAAVSAPVRSYRAPPRFP